MDQFEPSGHGRRKREDKGNSSRTGRDANNATQFTKFKENIEYTVLMPGGKLYIIFIQWCSYLKFETMSVKKCISCLFTFFKALSTQQY